MLSKGAAKLNRNWLGWVAIATLGTIVITPGIANSKPRQTAVQGDNGCFFTTSSGRTLNLDKLCGGSGTSRPSVTVAPQNQSVFLAKIKRRLHGIPVIDVTFNGNRTFEMIVDTGASGTLITRSMAISLQVPVIGSVQSTIADGSKVRFPVGRIQSMAVSGAVVQNVNVAIAEQMDVGLLGHDFFENYDVKIKRDVVEFYRR